MTTPTAPTIDEITAFAKRHGLTNLAPEHLARMTELARTISELGQTLPRPLRKEDGPAVSGAPKQ